MPDSGANPPTDRPSSTGPWPPVVAPSEGPILGDDPPTVRTGSDPGRPLGSSLEPQRIGSPRGSSVRRNVSEVPPLPEVGDSIETFVLDEAIGVGGMGAVFRATDTRLDRQVALKVLPADLARDSEAIQRFYQEGRSAARLDHENIARVYSIGHDGSIHYIVFEYIEGTTIRQRVERDGILSVGDAIDVTLQITEALAHASARGVVHRDVKPSNIIITPEGRAKLVDMGLARRFERGGDTGLTQTGMTLGTFDYISPEQARDPRDVDVRGDLYSLGCTLFFMLSGRPPFPDGTILAKLIQHKEEPPPDIRESNPSVPDEMAAVLSRLMAKDRDRRYQTPDQLIRELLALSGSLGLRLSISGRSGWPTPTPPPAWERHLIWAIPALAFAALISALVISSQAPTLPTKAPLAGATDLTPRVKNAAVDVPPGTRKDAPGKAIVAPAPILPRDIAVNAGDDLARVILEAPPRSTILLADDGPYTIRPAARGETQRFSGLDLTIKADLGTRPVIRFARGTGERDASPGSALFDLKGGRVALEGLELIVDSSDREESTAAIQAEDVELSVSRCLFRRVGRRPEGQGGAFALRLRSTGRGSPEAGRRTSSAFIDACHIDGGLTTVFAEGPVEIGMRDTTIGPAAGATFQCQNPDGLGPASIYLRHVSLLCGSGPVFSCSGLAPRVRVNDCVIAPSGDLAATLVEADEPTRLDWRGADNLYGRIAVYLQPRRPSSATGGLKGVTSFDAWADDPASPREYSSAVASRQVWDDPDPARALASETQDPSRLFRLAEARSGLSRIGARQGPLGPLAPPTKLVADRPGGAAQSDRELLSSSIVGTSPLAMVGPVLPGVPDLATRPMQPSEPPRTSSERPPTSNLPEVDPAEEMPEMAVMPPMPLSNGSKPERPDPSPAPDGAASSPATSVTGTNAPDGNGQALPTSPKVTASTPKNPAIPNVGAASEPSESKVIRTSEALVEALRKASSKGETLRLATNADWELPASVLSGRGRWTIRAETGTERPKLRFRPSESDLMALKAGASPAWLTVLTGSLQLEGVDLIIPALPAASKLGAPAAFVLGTGGDLTLTDCTLTVEGDRPTAAAIRIVAGESGRRPERHDPSPASVRFKNSLLRSGGDLIDVAPSEPLDLEIDNAVIATGGSLVHGHSGEIPVDAKTIKITIRQVSARLTGGIIQLDSTPDSPEPPFAEISARNSIFATTSQGDPLIRIDGQDDAEALRGRVNWDGHNVAYHRISTYRRDQVRKLGTPPILFDRASWEVAVGRREVAPIHEDLKFSKDWAENRDAWTLTPDDVRLRTDSPASVSGSGADLSHIPNPPAIPS